MAVVLTIIMIIVGVALVMIGLDLCDDRQEYKGVACSVCGIAVAVTGFMMLMRF